MRRRENRPTTASHGSSARRLVALAAAASLTLAACGSDDGGGSAAQENAPVTGGPDEVEVTLVDFAFEGLPERVPAGTTITLTNDAVSELHELVAFRVPDDEDRSVEELLELSPEEMMAALGGPPAMVLLAEPQSSETIVAVGDGTLEEPGRYVVLCVIPTGADPAEYLAAAATSDGPPEVEGGPPHVAHGMWAELVVE
ncbi:MAG: hypothetical protein JJU45_12315 [Acidimicrobiia bacterium]|nr:hypothetical protein [Acidimicrobiia bacterium]